MNIPDIKFVEVAQTYPSAPPLDFAATLAAQFRDCGLGAQITPGMRIAVGVGSRGIANLKEIVQAVLRPLIDAGARPFLIPAMGSHGGATPDGQAHVLAEYGITEESVGVPIETAMEVEKIGTALDGLDVVFSAAALRADAIVVVNRVKPHTDFRGTLGSGIQKMLTIGFGKQAGAANAHRAAAHVGHEIVIREFARVILEKVPVLCGIAILEDQNHRTAELHVLPRNAIAVQEPLLLERARAFMPRLPLDEIDLLIVDEIGKEISGTGMDTNIVGRDITGYSTSLREASPVTPRIFRILVRDLSHATNGNGIGIGLADFTTSRVAKALDLQATYINATTSIGLQPAKLPIHFDTDRETIGAALSSLASLHPEKLRVVRIANTLSLDRILVSESCVDALEKRPGITVSGSPCAFKFDQVGNLSPF